MTASQPTADRLPSPRRTDPLTTSATTLRQLEALRSAGLTWGDIGRRTGVWGNTLRVAHARRYRRIRASTARRVTELHDDLCVPQPADHRRWPVAPLRARIEARYGSLANMPDPNMRRRLYNPAGTITTITADRYATAAGWHPAEIWDDWYDDEGAV